MIVYVVSIEEQDYQPTTLRVFSTRDKAELFVYNSANLIEESAAKIGPWATETESVFFDVNGDIWYIDAFELDSDRIV